MASDEEIISKIKEIIEMQIRPAVMGHGGDITFHSFEDGVVYVTLRGACSGCPGAVYTLKMGVENALKNALPEVKEVRQVRQSCS